MKTNNSKPKNKIKNEIAKEKLILGFKKKLKFKNSNRIQVIHERKWERYGA